MSNLAVTERNGILVVDSRLVATELGIEHPTLLKNIDKYSTRLEAKSPLRFEVDVVKRRQGGGSHTRYAWLDERQATLLMTYSRNTEQVLNCKDALVDAFMEARQVIPAQSQEIERLKLELELARAQQSNAQSQERLIQVSSAIVTMHGAAMLSLILNKPEAIVEQPIVIEKNILVNQAGKQPWVYVVNQELAQALGCCRDTVFRHLKDLCQMGILKKAPYKRWSTDYIWAYCAYQSKGRKADCLKVENSSRKSNNTFILINLFILLFQITT